MNKHDISIIKARVGRTTPKIICIESAGYMYDGIDKSVVILDQENEIGHTIFSSNNKYVYRNAEDYEVQSFKFENIMTINSFMNKDDIIHLLDELINDEVIDEEQKNKILKTLKIIK